MNPDQEEQRPHPVDTIQGASDVVFVELLKKPIITVFVVFIYLKKIFPPNFTFKNQTPYFV